MKKIKITDNLYQFQFLPFENQHFGFNIYAFIDGNKAMLLDTAFAEHAKQTKAYLAKDAITITEVIFSHFHPDHISGLPELDRPKIYGNGLYQVSLDQHTPKEKHHYFEPMNILNDNSTMTFGSFDFQFRLIQGHVICGMFTVINNKFIHVADDLMASNDGIAILPSIQIDNAQKHIDSLELLKQYKHCTLLLSHGNAISGEQIVLEAIEQRQHYLKALVAHQGKISIEQALENSACEFLHREWHDYVYR